MKPLFGIDLTTDKKNETPNAEQFLVAKPSAAAAWKNEQAVEESLGGLREFCDRYGKKSGLLIGSVFCGVIAFVLLSVVALMLLQARRFEAGEYGVLAAGVLLAVAAVVCGVLNRRIKLYPESGGGELVNALREDAKRGRKSKRLLICAVVFMLFAYINIEQFFSLRRSVFSFALLGAGVAFLCVAVLFWLLSRKAEREAEAEPNSKPKKRGRKDDGKGKDAQPKGDGEDDEQPHATVAEIFSELGVPKTAASVDVLGFKYRDRRGRFRPRGTTGLNGKTVYYCYTLKWYVRNGRLLLADADGVIAVPLNEIKAIRTIRKRILLPGWTMDGSLTNEKRKPYELKTARSSYGEEWLSVGWYHVLAFEHKGETWGIWFPNYELPAVEKLTGLKADEKSASRKELFTL